MQNSICTLHTSLYIRSKLLYNVGNWLVYCCCTVQCHIALRLAKSALKDLDQTGINVRCEVEGWVDEASDTAGTRTWHRLSSVYKSSSMTTIAQLIKHCTTRWRHVDIIILVNYKVMLNCYDFSINQQSISQSIWTFIQLFKLVDSDQSVPVAWCILWKNAAVSHNDNPEKHEIIIPIYRQE